MSSSSIAGRSEEPRERFLGICASAGIMFSFLLLLFFLFPERNIVRTMALDTSASPVVLGYRQVMLRQHPHDVQARMLLAEGLIESGQFSAALGVLNENGDPLPAKELLRWNRARYHALRGVLAASKAGTAERKRMLADFSSVVRELAKIDPRPSELWGMAAEAKTFGDGATAALLDDLIAAGTLGQGGTAPDYYRRNARGFFEAMQKAKRLELRRGLFAKGVRLLQAGNLAGEALAAGEANIGGLATDRDTLLLMTRVALAAGRPDIAQRYIRKALGMDRERNEAGDS